MRVSGLGRSIGWDLSLASLKGILHPEFHGSGCHSACVRPRGVFGPPAMAMDEQGICVQTRQPLACSELCQILHRSDDHPISVIDEIQCENMYLNPV